MPSNKGCKCVILSSRERTEGTSGKNENSALHSSHDRQSDTQLYPIVVRLYDASLGRITDVLSFPSCTGENIFHLLNDALTTRNIPWSNCIAFESDSASVMIGTFKGVAAFVKKKNNPQCTSKAVCVIPFI